MRQQGFSLIEAALSVLLVGGIMVVSMDGVGRVARARASAAQMQRGTVLAQWLTNAIVASAFNDPAAGNTTIGRDADESLNDRTTLDDIDDFDGLDESPPKDRAGALLIDSTGWRWTAAVTWVDPVTFARSNSPTNLKRVVVTVYRNMAKVVALEALRTAGTDTARLTGRSSSSSATVAHTTPLTLP